VDVTTADLTVGTSAGATAAAQLALAPPPELLAAVLAPAVPRPGSLVTPHRGAPPRTAVEDHLTRMRALIASAEDAGDLRRRVGAAALEAESRADGSWQARWHATVAARLPDPRWPDRPVLLTAIDARTGEPVVFDRHSGVDLVDAVAASCSSGLPYRIGDIPYLDGGFRRDAENADLAAGHARVLVLSPFGGRALTPASWGLHLDTQLDELRAGGSRVETIAPDPGAEHLFGVQAMDPSLRPLAARVGSDQGEALAEHLAAFWS